MVIMLVANYSTVRNNLKSYCDMAFDQDETIVVTRKDNKNIVMLSMDRFNEMEKQIRNAQYLSKIDRSFEQLYSGNGQVHDLIEE